MSDRNERGFTLIEVMVALVIFLIGSLALTSLLFAVIKTNRNSYILTEAVVAGRMEMERIMSQPDPASSCDAAGVPPFCPTFAGCAAECAREVMVRGTDIASSHMWFQVDSSRDRGGFPAPAAFITVSVRWPRDEATRALRNGDAGWVDCLANPLECKVLPLHNQKL